MIVDSKECYTTSPARQGYRNLDEGRGCKRLPPTHGGGELVPRKPLPQPRDLATVIRFMFDDVKPFGEIVRRLAIEEGWVHFRKPVVIAAAEFFESPSAPPPIDGGARSRA